MREGVKEISMLLQEAAKVTGRLSRGFSTDILTVFTWRTGDSKLICLRESGVVAVKETE